MCIIINPRCSYHFPGLVTENAQISYSDTIGLLVTERPLPHTAASA